MKKKVIFFAITVVLLFLIVFSFNSGRSAAKYSAGFKVNNAVLKNADKNDSNLVGVIVSLNYNASDEQIKAYLKKGKIIGRNLIALDLNSSEISRLANNNEIERIEYNYPIAAFLQQSAGIINATLSWSVKINGLNLTGINQTVCIIDTGVNYTHPDLGGCLGNSTSSNCKVIGGWDFINNNGNPMDDNGHGTHVAGIVAANGSITGISPGAKIVAIKALDSTGSGTEADLISAINWCVNNATQFNIGVISMSLGTQELFNSYCDSDFTDMASAINNAVAKNISVVAASGNDANNTDIASPACIQNTTAVSATNKDDTIASYSDYNSLVQLFAPGTNINSTMIPSPKGDVLSSCGTGHNYCVLSGTSMAAPHVAASIALIREYLQLAGKTKTTNEISNALNKTGKKITDGASNFSRINVYNTLSYFDDQSFNVALISPSNNSLQSLGNESFSCNVSSAIPLSNITFYIWNDTSIISNQSKNIAGTFNISSFSYNLTDGNYKWNCIPSNGITSSFAPSNYSIQEDAGNLLINVSLPVNASFNNGMFNLSLSKAGNCSYSINNKNNISMNTSDNLNFWAINQSLLQNANYNITYYCNDSFGDFNKTLSFFQFDIINPNVTLISPNDGYSATGSQNIDFSFNVSDNINISSCSLVINSANVSTATNISNLTNDISYSVSPGSYSWGINCTDIAGNTGNGGLRSLTINSPPSGGGGGGGGSARKIVSNNATSNSTNISSSVINNSLTSGLGKDNNQRNHTFTASSSNANNRLNSISPAVYSAVGAGVLFFIIIGFIIAMYARNLKAIRRLTGAGRSSAHNSLYSYKNKNPK